MAKDQYVTLRTVNMAKTKKKTMDINALAEKLARLNTVRDENSNLWFKPTEEEQRIRLVPYPHQNDPFIEMYFHYQIGNERSLVCPQQMFGKPCPVCDLAEEIRNKGGDENYKLYNQYKAKLRVYTPIIVRGKEEEGFILCEL